MYVMGEKMGQKVYPGGPNPGPGGPSTTQMERQMGMNFGVGMGGNPQALLAQQNNSMEALDRRRERSGSMSAVSIMLLRDPITPNIFRTGPASATTTTTAATAGANRGR